MSAFFSILDTLPVSTLVSYTHKVNQRTLVKLAPLEISTIEKKEKGDAVDCVDVVLLCFDVSKNNSLERISSKVRIHWINS